MYNNTLIILLVSVVSLGQLKAQEISKASQQEFKIVTVVESIVPMGLGRSRIIDSKTQVDAAQFATERTDGTKSNQKEISRKDIKIDELEETKLLNFFSATGINFQNIASNDAMIASKINSMISEGWNLTYVTSGVESNAGADDGQGIFITRLFFSRNQLLE
ncbi:hypothetical protein J2X69_005093 [Algoriphagus sp. 4150]|uniref:hypothetical protein n=1 Tax=Algoriphagus sp. 4150 TaxID=2817756 RepID=UPI002855D3F7|nr:hypothetical protein [Algoriphagus sp. 4150]MDR7132719.1 hypothetical protein [Algoriphagus sp. 4150]